MVSQAEISEALLGTDVDPEISWAENELPERERTKHVHRLHPYLGKYVPQLVEVFLNRHFTPGDLILDPFSGSGTTLVEASVYGCPSVGVDISAFNALLSRVKSGIHNPVVVEHDLRAALARVERYAETSTPDQATPATGSYLAAWYAPRALDELLFYRGLVDDYPDTRELMSVVLSRSARSARRTAHHDLEFPRAPVTGPYDCHKHKRTCHPTSEALKFLRRYSLDTIVRVREYARIRTLVAATVLHDDARTVNYRDHRFAGIITSPPYPGRIDYHEQHRYAFELLGLDDQRSDEIGAAVRGFSRRVTADYVADMTAVFAHARAHTRPGGVFVIVIDDARDLYRDILDAAGLTVTERRRRHVNRRTGRRSGEFYEQVIVASEK
jgi:hypothetical protein